MTILHSLNTRYEESERQIHQQACLDSNKLLYILLKKTKISFKIIKNRFAPENIFIALKHG